MKNNSLGKVLNRYCGRVIRVSSVGEGVKSIILSVEDLPRISPGQFVMAWIPGFEEIPLSPSFQEGRILRLTVAAVGSTSQEFHKLKVRDRVLVRGPYGRGFTLTYKKPLIIGGGYGIAPLLYTAYKYVKNSVKPEVVIGGKTRNHLYHLSELENLGLKVYPYTEDGSFGFKGVATDYLVEAELSKYDAILACGPEKMMYNIYRVLEEKNVLELFNVEFSLERIIKCGVGICGSCSIGGYLVCRDGPVFKIEELKGTEFGYWMRGWSGERVEIDS